MKNVYLLLAISIVLEVIGATFMKFSNGFTDFDSSLIVIISYALALSMYILITVNHELGIINALWSGGGTTLITVIGVLLFNETISYTKLLGVGFILIGIIGLTLKIDKLKFKGRSS